jgi:hypothetical protein
MTSLLFAFCGFFVSGANAKLYNNASQVVLMRKGSTTVMTMSNNYKGPPEDFAMVVPVPVVLQKHQVKTLPHDVFKHIDELSAPRLVEYWEQDPCNPGFPGGLRLGSGGGAAAPMKAAESAAPKDLGVKIEAKFSRGEYEILILSAKEAEGLETWLHQNNYKIPDGAADALAPYVRDQMKFFVAKVNIQKVKHDAQGLVQLSPLRFHFREKELRLPVRLGLLNAESKQDLIVYVLHPEKRFEVANYKTVPIPTNLDVADEVRKTFAEFYAELFDATLAQSGGKAVITEYSWDTGSCDPCPTPPLDPSELAVLGADVLGDEAQSGNFVLTRLHTRYDKQTLSEDLVFKTAPPMIGGREGENKTRIAREDVNNFQGRYIIRHYWQGKVACQNPHWGVWGENPHNTRRREKPSAATGLANAARGKVVLADVVNTAVPSLGIAGKKHKRGEK